jgi:succinyl-diaminopimelate desuccinylase
MDQKAGRLTGRGVSDMKFAVVCFAEAIRTILAQTPDDHPSFCIMLTSDEERGGFHGVDYLVNRVGYRPKVVIIPDGGDNWHIVEKAKGARLIEITLPGRAAHASRPWEGTSAIDAAAELVHTINQLYPNPQEASWHTSHNFGKITGGTAGNQVADSATLWLDIRYTEELPADIIQAKVAQHFPQAQTQVIVDKPFFTVDRHHPAVQLWAQLLRAEVATTPQVDAELFQFEGGSADHHYFSQHHIPVIVSKPEGGLIHTEAEWMSVEGIAAFTRVLTQFMLTYKG